MLGNKLDANNTIILYIKKLTKQLHKTASTIGFIDSKKYYEKLETIVREGIKSGIYKETTDTTFKKIF